jgi:quinol monooxygenase YgiN
MAALTDRCRAPDFAAGAATCPDLARPAAARRASLIAPNAQLLRLSQKGSSVLVKVFPINLKPGKQAEVEEIVEEFAAKGPSQEPGTLSFRVYRDPARPDYLMFVEHFADQAAYDAHIGSTAYKELIAGRFAGLITEFTEIDHELIVGI